MAYKLTKSLIDSIPYPETGQVFYRDAELKGFGLRVGTGSKVYVAEGKVDGVALLGKAMAALADFGQSADVLIDEFPVEHEKAQRLALPRRPILRPLENFLEDRHARVT